MILNPVLDEIMGEQSFSYIAKAKAIEREKGIRVISFGVGQPDFDTPSHIKEAAKRALDEGFTGYTETPGILELRQAIADYLNERYGAGVGPDNIMVTTGGKTALFLAIAATVKRGSEVIIPEPSYYAYAQVAKIFGAKPVYVPLRWSREKGFEIDLDPILEKITPNTTAIILNNPSNPTGALFSKEQVRRLYDEAASRGIAVVADEVYDNFVYDGEFYSVTSIDGWMENAVLAHSFSKTFAMTGWRLGFVAADKRVIDKLFSLAVSIYSCATSFAQKAGVAALKGDWEPVRRMIAEFNERRKLMYELLNKVPGFEPNMPGGAFYMFPRVRRALDMLGMDVVEFVETLLAEKGVLILPGSSFPDKTGRDFVRISYASSREDIIEGMNRLREFVEERAR